MPGMCTESFDEGGDRVTKQEIEELKERKYEVMYYHLGMYMGAMQAFDEIIKENERKLEKVGKNEKRL